LIEEVPSVTIYPNPLTGPLSLYFRNMPAENATVVIFNAAGQRVYNRKVDVPGGYVLFETDLSYLARGMYVLNINSGSFKFTQQLLR
jgi:hypothetical protein